MVRSTKFWKFAPPRLCNLTGLTAQPPLLAEEGTPCPATALKPYNRSFLDGSGT